MRDLVKLGKYPVDGRLDLEGVLHERGNDRTERDILIILFCKRSKLRHVEVSKWPVAWTGGKNEISVLRVWLCSKQIPAYRERRSSPVSCIF